MRMAEYKQIETELDEYYVKEEVIDENGIPTGEIISRKEYKETPIYGMVYRDMTPEEEAEYLKAQAEIPTPEPTFEDRIEAQVMFTALMTDTLLEE